MSDTQFEAVKKEIRSFLLTYQKGCTLSEFKREYRNFIGRPLPSKEFSFKDDLTFLSSMPDAVAIYNSQFPGEYHLIGIADQSVKHIQKLVAKQKPSKHKPTYRPPRRLFARTVSRQKAHASGFEPVRYSSDVSPSYPVSRHQIHETKMEPMKPRSYATPFPVSHQKIQEFQTEPVSQRSNVPPRFRKQAEKEAPFIKKEPPSGVEKYVIRMLQCCPEGLRLSHFEESFRNMYKREFAFRDWGFSTLEECLETIPGLVPLVRNNEIFVHLEEEEPVEISKSVDIQSKGSGIQSHCDNLLINLSPDKTDNSQLNSRNVDYFDKNLNKSGFVNDVQHTNSSNQNESKHPFDDQYLSKGVDIAAATSSAKNNDYSMDRPNRSGKLDDFQLPDFQNSSSSASNSPPLLYSYPNTQSKKADQLESFMRSSHNLHKNVSDNIQKNLLQVMEKHPQGIFASEFPSAYEKVTGSQFDLHSLGFYHLADFIDSVPDVFNRESLPGSKKDWLIVPAKPMENANAAEIVPGKGSILFIECVILNTRKILQGCEEGIRLNEFDRLYSINCNEPLYIRDLGYDNLESFLLSIAQRVPLKIASVGGDKVVFLEKFEEVIKTPSPLPLNIAPPDAKFKDLKLPAEYINTQYYPMYTSSIASPGFFYIQLQGDDYSEPLKVLYDELEEFYYGDLGDSYTMKPKDIKVGAACIALWPSDQQWYRARIISIVSFEFVMVFYVDYGTTDEIPLHMLRYIRPQYLDLPAQALKSRLKYLKPPNQATAWDKRSRQRMLELCQNRSLMGRIEDAKDGVLSLILCDTNGTEDLFINDVLVQEGIAELYDAVEKPEQPTLSPTEMTPQQLLVLLGTLASAVGITNPSAGVGDITKMIQNCSLNPGFVPGVANASPPLISLSPVSQILPPYVPSVNSSQSNSLQSAFNMNFMNPIYPLGVPPTNQTVKSPGDTITESDFVAPQPTKHPSISPPSTPSPDACDVFDEDDDASFEEFYQKFSAARANAKMCYVRRVKTEDGYVFHVLLYNSKPFVSSGDISVLIWSTKDPFHLFNRLQTQSIELPSVTLQEEGHEQFFEQLRRFSVKGITQTESNNSSVLMYPLEKVNKILNHFGHPSASLRIKVLHESQSFDSSAPHWQESSHNEVPEKIEEVRSVTDDDKLNRLCLYDLKTMREGIRMKRLNLSKHQGGASNVNVSDEIEKLDQLFCKVRDRIREIELICNLYS